MSETTGYGLNRTGIGMSPIDAPQTIQGAADPAPMSFADDFADDPDGMKTARQIRMDYMDGRPVGTMPPPTTVRGAVSTLAKMLQGEHANILLDKLGQRLAFERQGVRLYKAFLMKLRGHPTAPTSIPVDEVEENLKEELAHFHLIKDVLTGLGADPTTITPCADTGAVATSGWIAVMTDPRTDVPQCLEILLMAELVDVDAWTTVIQLFEDAGHADIAQGFRQAAVDEEKHLLRVRAWLKVLLSDKLNLRTPAAETRH